LEIVSAHGATGSRNSTKLSGYFLILGWHACRRIPTKRANATV
jgi:hypothetical protein